MRVKTVYVESWLLLLSVDWVRSRAYCPLAGVHVWDMPGAAVAWLKKWSRHPSEQK